MEQDREGTYSYLLSQAMLTPEQLAAIGCLAVESTHLEFYIEKMIGRLCFFNEHTSDIFTGRLTIGPKTDLLGKLLKPSIENTTKGDSFKIIFDDIKDAISDRNTVIHGEWGDVTRDFDALTKFLTEMPGLTAKRKGKGREIKASEIIEIAIRFGKLQMRLADWWLLDYLGASPASPATPAQSRRIKD